MKHYASQLFPSPPSTLPTSFPTSIVAASFNASIAATTLTPKVPKYFPFDRVSRAVHYSSHKVLRLCLQLRLFRSTLFPETTAYFGDMFLQLRNRRLAEGILVELQLPKLLLGCFYVFRGRCSTVLCASSRTARIGLTRTKRLPATANACCVTLSVFVCSDTLPRRLQPCAYGRLWNLSSKKSYISGCPLSPHVQSRTA